MTLLRVDDVVQHVCIGGHQAEVQWLQGNVRRGRRGMRGALMLQHSMQLALVVAHPHPATWPPARLGGFLLAEEVEECEGEVVTPIETLILRNI